MRTVGTLFDICSGTSVVDGLCARCGRKTAKRADGTPRVHEDASVVFWALANSTTTYSQFAEETGLSLQVVDWTIRLYPRIRRARRADRENRRLDAEWASFCAAVQRAIDEGRRCPVDGSWVLRPYSTCSPECNLETDRVCYECGHEGPPEDFARYGDRRRNLCNECNAQRAAAWRDDAEYPVMVPEKQCPACTRLLDASAFTRATHSKSGLQTYCRDCRRALDRGESVAEIQASRGIEYERTRQTFEVATR